jgi:hypothetical protein
MSDGAIVVGPGEGERFDRGNRTVTIVADLTGAHAQPPRSRRGLRQGGSRPVVTRFRAGLFIVMPAA